MKVATFVLIALFALSTAALAASPISAMPDKEMQINDQGKPDGREGGETIDDAFPIAELPYLSGLGFRVVTWIIVTAVALDRHRQAFTDNPRMRLVLNSLARRSDAQLQTDRAVFEWMSSVLGEGGTVRPEQRPEVEDA